jgi:multidrug efflux pump subunit AcrB
MTSFSIKNSVLTLSLVCVLVFLGINEFTKMPQDSMPPYTVRFSNVVTSFPGASPERVEMLVTDKIEKQLQQVAELDHVDSESRTGISVISIKIKDEYTDMQPIYDKIRRKVEEIQHELPAGASVKIQDEDLADIYGVIYSITGDGYTPAELLEIAETVRDGLIKLPNAAKVAIVGEQVEQIFIDYDNAKFAELGLSQEMIKSILSKTNIIFPGGDLKIGNERIILEPTGNYEAIDDLKKTIVSNADSSEIIYLGDVADIYRGYKKPTESIVKIGGVRGISLGIALKAGGNVVNLGKEVDQLIEYYKGIYPYGVEFTRSASQDLFVEKSVKDFVNNLIQSVVVVLIVMLLFLGLRTGVVVASLIPAVIVTTLLLMSSAGVGLNQVSLAALIMALGMLVDNAIVMAESIMVKMEKGDKAFDAAVSSANELKVPLLISSLTTSAAFLPFYLAQSTMGEIVGEIFVVITFALLSSWVFALTLIPLLGIYFIKIKKGKKKKKSLFDRFNNVYHGILMFNLKHPWLLIVVIIISFAGSVYGLRFIPSIFMPDSERSLVTANFELPIGTDIKRTEDIIGEIENYISDYFLVNKGRLEGVVDFTSYIGEGAPKYDLGYTAPEKTTYTAHILINTTSNEANQVIIEKLDAFCFENFPDLTPTINRLGTGGGSSDPVAVRISGDDSEKLFEIVESVKTKLRQINGSKNVGDDWGLKTKKIIVDVNQERAQFAGISNQDIAISLETILKGRETGRFREGDKSIPIIMTDKSSQNLTIESLEGMNIQSQQTGKSVPLSQIADLDIQWQSTKIKRRSQLKTMTAISDLEVGFTASSIVKELRPWLLEQKKLWGYGYDYELGGEAENSEDGMGSVIVNLPIAFFLIALLLIGQFNSLKKPLIVLLTIPLGLIGVVFGLLVTQSYFGFFAFLGLISLAGIIINNAIVLLDRIQIEQDEMKRNKQDAILFAAKERFRPIMLTTATTVCGLIPLWLGGGIMFEPLAVGILFGLLFATVITLLFVPVMYRLLFRVSYKNI